MKYGIKNKYTNKTYSFNTRTELDTFCDNNGLKLNTLERSKREGRESLTGWSLVEPIVSGKKNGKTVLFIGDLHLPFEHEEYFEHCKNIYEKHNCDTVVFAGDIVDNHYLSYHENHQDALGGRDELDIAIFNLKRWYKQFPNAYVMIGNHDALPQRKAQSSGITKHWIKEFSEVLQVPNWVFLPEIVIDNVLYLHGTGRQANRRCMQDNISVAQGHFHSNSYIQYYVGHDGSTKFACQVGCGVDIDSYAMEYGRAYAKPHINVAVIKDGQATLEYIR